MKLLIAGSFPLTQQQQLQLEQFGYEVIRAEREDGELPEDALEAEAVICNWLFVHHPADRFQKLRCVQLLSAGFDRVPVEAFQKRGISLYNARGVYSIPMAEFALSGVLQLYKHSFAFYENQRYCQWNKDRTIRELSNAKVCIVGAGSVGQETAKKFRAFTDDIIGVDLFPHSSPYFQAVLPLDSLDTVLAESDIVILTLPLTEQTKGMFGLQKFQCMKKDAVIVNIARGGLIRESDLKEALASRLYGAVLDVFEEEPLPAHNTLWNMKNVIITPHNSFVSDKNSERMWAVISHNLHEFICERKNVNE